MSNRSLLWIVLSYSYECVYGSFAPASWLSTLRNTRSSLLRTSRKSTLTCCSTRGPQSLFYCGGVCSFGWRGILWRVLEVWGPLLESSWATPWPFQLAFRWRRWLRTFFGCASWLLLFRWGSLRKMSKREPRSDRKLSRQGQKVDLGSEKLK